MKIIAIIKKEYREIVKKKSFIISTILTPLIMAVFMFLPVMLMKMGKGEKTIQVADYSGFIYEKMVQTEKTPATAKTSPVVRPTCRIASGSNTSTPSACCAAASARRTPSAPPPPVSTACTRRTRK